ncbi:MAG: DoxX family protein [Blastocatellia bacterium]|nr:MAG: DoxX family protein [Blastocatellia bacterium]
MAGAGVSRGRRIAGWILTVLPSLFLLMDGVMKLFKPEFVVSATVRLGYAENTIVPIGMLLIVCTLIYLLPSTSVLGAILLTGYLGGAVATHVRAGEGAFPILFPVAFGILIWGGLYLRDLRFKTLIPVRISGEQS